MIQFEIPQNLNGEQLINELIAAGVTISEPPLVDGDRNLWLEINASDKIKAQSIVANHKGIDSVKVLTIEEKLQKVGLTLDDLKTALGL